MELVQDPMWELSSHCSTKNKHPIIFTTSGRAEKWAKWRAAKYSNLRKLETSQSNSHCISCLVSLLSAKECCIGMRRKKKKSLSKCNIIKLFEWGTEVLRKKKQKALFSNKGSNVELITSNSQDSWIFCVVARGCCSTMAELHGSWAVMHETFSNQAFIPNPVAMCGGNAYFHSWPLFKFTLLVLLNSINTEMVKSL